MIKIDERTLRHVCDAVDRSAWRLDTCVVVGVMGGPARKLREGEVVAVARLFVPETSLAHLATIGVLEEVGTLYGPRNAIHKVYRPNKNHAAWEDWL